jgi:hypothetical protein
VAKLPLGLLPQRSQAKAQTTKARPHCPQTTDTEQISRKNHEAQPAAAAHCSTSPARLSGPIIDDGIAATRRAATIRLVPQEFFLMFSRLPKCTSSFPSFRPPLGRALAAAAAALLLAPAAMSQTLDLSLNVIYSNPANPNSGGTWQLAAKSSNFGIAYVEALLRNVIPLSIDQAAPAGIVNGDDPAGFNEFLVASNVGYTQLFIGQSALNPSGGPQEGAFYGVGTLANGAPGDIGPTYSSLTSLTGVPWATGDVFADPAWNTAAILATGAFAQNVTPGFFQAEGAVSHGSVFTSLGTATTFGGATLVDPVTSAVVRTNFINNADYNHNGIVDAADYTVWRDTLGSTTILDADGNSNNVIDQGDYVVWKTNFGTMPGAGSGLGASAVPEPTTSILLASVLACVVAARRGLAGHHRGDGRA